MNWLSIISDDCKDHRLIQGEIGRLTGLFFEFHQVLVKNKIIKLREILAEETKRLGLTDPADITRFKSNLFVRYFPAEESYAHDFRYLLLAIQDVLKGKQTDVESINKSIETFSIGKWQNREALSKEFTEVDITGTEAFKRAAEIMRLFKMYLNREKLLPSPG